MQIDLLLVSVLRVLVEVAGFALLGQGILALLAGKHRFNNLFYKILQTITGPAIKAVRFITPLPPHLAQGSLGMVPFAPQRPQGRDILKKPCW